MLIPICGAALGLKKFQCLHLGSGTNGNLNSEKEKSIAAVLV